MLCRCWCRLVVGSNPPADVIAEVVPFFRAQVCNTCNEQQVQCCNCGRIDRVKAMFMGQNMKGQEKYNSKLYINLHDADLRKFLAHGEASVVPSSLQFSSGDVVRGKWWNPTHRRVFLNIGAGWTAVKLCLLLKRGVGKTSTSVVDVYRGYRLHYLTIACSLSLSCTCSLNRSASS